ncbi:allantoinase AllB [Niallia sp. 01092]|uniref:allantoinase AllB n=1 Tax=unclassified Niallia TaxID=2837522 RepID=UPI003FD65379
MEKYDLIIRNGSVVKEKEVVKEDIGVLNGKIVTLSELPDEIEAKQTIDATGLHIFPGLIDSHVHFNEPGRTEWEGFETGSKSLAAGGVTLFFDMPLNSHPPTTTKSAFELKNTIAEEKSIVDYRLWGGVVPGNADDLEALMQSGVIGFKAFMSNSGIEDFKSSDDQTLYTAMEKIAAFDGILAVHAESDVITSHLGKLTAEANDNRAASFSSSRPIYSEVEAVQRILAYAEATKCKLHIVHISSTKVLEPILAAKQKGIDVTVETCPHYLSLTIEDLESLGAVAKCAPPLRDQTEIEALWEAVKNGEIDTIASDHSPSPAFMKEGSFLEAWGGISGCQSTFNILLEEGYWKRQVSLPQLANVFSLNPAKRFGLEEQKGSIFVNKDADFVLVDLEEAFILNKEDLLYRNKQSPYVGREFRGKIKQTIIAGAVVYED